MALEALETSWKPLKYLLMIYGSWRIIRDLVSYSTRKMSGGSGTESKNVQKLQYQINQRKPPELWNQAFFFPDYIPEEPNSVTSQIVEILNSAKISIQ
ncbi:unnamed protein product, partial [Allacma fusca]